LIIDIDLIEKAVTFEVRLNVNSNLLNKA